MKRVLGGFAIMSAVVALTSAAVIAGPLAPTPVPEPSVLALMATGVGALIIIKFRKRK